MKTIEFKIWIVNRYLGTIVLSNNWKFIPEETSEWDISNLIEISKQDFLSFNGCLAEIVSIFEEKEWELIEVERFENGVLKTTDSALSWMTHYY